MQGASGLPAGFSASGGQEDEAAAQRRAEAEIARAGMLKAILAPTALARRAWVLSRRLRECFFDPHGAARPRASRLHHPPAPPIVPPVSRVALVKPDNARAVEDHVIKLARAGKLGGAQVDEESVIKMLEEVSSQAAAAAGGGAVKKVTIVRRKRAGSSEDEEDF